MSGFFLPQIRAQVVDRNGRMTKEFYDFLNNLLQEAGLIPGDAVEDQTSATLLGASAQEALTEAAESKALSEEGEERINALEARLQQSQVPDLTDDIETLQKEFAVLLSSFHEPRFTYSYNETPPAFNTLVTVPSSVRERAIIASISMEGGASASQVDAEVETDRGSGVYEVVCSWRRAAGATLTIAPGSFFVAGGRRYRFVEVATGGTRSIATYSFRDLIDNA